MLGAAYNALLYTDLVTIPILYPLVFGNGEKVVGARFKDDLHDAFVVCKDGLVAIPEIHTPDLDILVCGRSDNEFRI